MVVSQHATHIINALDLPACLLETVCRPCLYPEGLCSSPSELLGIHELTAEMLEGIRPVVRSCRYQHVLEILEVAHPTHLLYDVSSL